MLTPPLINLETIANLRALSPDDNGTFMREIIGIFLEDTQTRLADLRASRDAGDAATFTRAAHSIKGSSSNVGALELRAAAEKLEHQARQHGLADTATFLAEIEAAFARVEPELRKLAG
jgi:HPt (histidine-containing phosphotransfer) domain-containing protein